MILSPTPIDRQIERVSLSRAINIAFRWLAGELFLSLAAAAASSILQPRARRSFQQQCCSAQDRWIDRYEEVLEKSSYYARSHTYILRTRIYNISSFPEMIAFFCVVYFLRKILAFCVYVHNEPRARFRCGMILLRVCIYFREIYMKFFRGTRGARDSYALYYACTFFLFRSFFSVCIKKSDVYEEPKIISRARTFLIRSARDLFGRARAREREKERERVGKGENFINSRDSRAILTRTNGSLKYFWFMAAFPLFLIFYIYLASFTKPRSPRNI